MVNELLYRTAVEAGGSVYKGIVFNTHVQFDDNHGSTLCLPFADVTADRVRKEVIASNAKYADTAHLMHPLLLKFRRA